MRPPGALGIGLLFVVATGAALATGNPAEDLYWEGEDGEPNEFLEVKDSQESGIGDYVRRIRVSLWDMWDNSNDKAYPDLEEPVRNRVKRQDIDNLDADYSTDEPPGRGDNNAVYEKDDEDFGTGSGDGPQRKREITLQVSFVVQEPYQDGYSNRDSIPFQNLSHTLADAVNALYDHLPGTQRATLVRIQSRPSDKFSCKVSMDLVTQNYYDLEVLNETLHDHIRKTRNLGNVVVNDEEFVFEQNDVLEGEPCTEQDFRCSSGQCVPAASRCNTTSECYDTSDEYGCDDETVNQELDQSLEVEPTEETTTPETTEPPIETTTTEFVCAEDFLKCDRTRCVPRSQLCDGVAQCSDGADELNCIRNCGVGDFRCRDGECIPASGRCNRVWECRSGEDEDNCPCNPLDEYKCDNKCIENRRVCDEVADCNDGTDEVNCDAGGTGKPWSGMLVCRKQGQFRCSDGTCLSVLMRCDGRVDCPADDTDEEDCPCKPDQWQCDFGACIKRSRRCDGHLDCPSDRSDERNCPDSPVKYTTRTPVPSTTHVITQVPSNSFACASGTLIPLTLRCNGESDCPPGDYSDENYCTPEYPNKPCGPEEFTCGNGSCIESKKRCDGTRDCQDGSDEISCVTFRCHDGTTIPLNLKCNKKKDCKDYSDEKNCPCGPEEFACGSGSRCIHPKKLCDGTRDCQDGSDEINCEKKCMHDEHKCPDGKCINLALLCNRRKDCADGSDEANCACSKDEFRCDSNHCINVAFRCDGVKQCPSGVDEKDCGLCPSKHWKCGDGTCISGDKRCNSRKDCEDNSDEKNCFYRPSQHEEECTTRCGDGTCIDEDKVCDGNRDCEDGADERPEFCGCDPSDFTCKDGDCIKPSLRCNGFLDCADESDEENCPITTKEPNETCKGNNFLCNNKECINFDFRCDGTIDCTDGSDEANCEDIACLESDWRCLSGECIDISEKCDGVQHCADNSDELPPACDSPVTSYPVTPYPVITPYPVTPYPVTSYPVTRAPTPESTPWWLTVPPTQYPYSPDPRYTTPAPTTPRYDNGLYTTQPWHFNTPDGCRRDEWRCENNPCIARHLRCNGQVDCPNDSSDELDCTPEYPTEASGLNLKVYDPQQQVKEGEDVVFRCRDEGSQRVSVTWVRDGGRPMPTGYKDNGEGRLELYNVKKEDGGNYICQARGFDRYQPGAEQSAHLSVTPRRKVAHLLPPISCQPHEATCSDGKCIPRAAICDGYYNCTDGSDESSCGVCEPNQFRCDNRRCVLKTWVCDSEDDCRDGSDEAHCSPPAPGALCHSYEFTCRNQQCIPRSYQCDGLSECEDGSDEVGCTAKVYISKPPPRSKYLNQGETMELTCAAVAVPTPQVIWRLNWGHIPPKCSYTSVDGLGTLTCPDVQYADQGAYSCEALSSKGSSFADWDTILTVKGSGGPDVCPSGYFNSEANSAQDCINCFCFGMSTRCKSADLYTYQLPTPLGEGGTVLLGLTQEASGQLSNSEQPINDLFYYQSTFRNGATVTKLVDSTPRDVHPYLTLPESYNGIQLTSYGGYIKYKLRPHNRRPVYSNLPDIVIKGKYATLVHHAAFVDSPRPEISLEARLLPQYWSKATSNGIVQASREDIMMALDNVERILLRAEVNGGGVNITDFKMDSAQRMDSRLGAANFVEECECPPGYTGLSCHKCQDGYVRESSGPWLGHCRQEEEKCPPGYYGEPRRGIPCNPCPCPSTSPGNQFARTCHLGSDGQVTCDCNPGYEGRRCETCAPGLVGNPLQPGDSCREPPRSQCNPDGTASERNGACICRDQVEGQYCDQCKRDSFFLSSDNPHGCAQCFCTGVTDQCGSSSLRRRTISTRFSSPQTSTPVYVVPGFTSRYTDPKPSNVIPQQYRGELVLRDFDRSQSNTYYWSLPDSFNGDKVTSYGGYLTYTVRHQPAPGGQSSRNNAASVTLISLNSLSFNYFGNVNPSSDGYMNGSVQLIEKYWQRSDGKPVQRSDFLMALSDVDKILVKATYTTNTQEAALASVSLDIAEEGAPGPRALHVEQCRCPRNYTGTSCEDCAPGYTRGSTGIYLENCVQCDCSGQSTQCHPESGVCSGCQHNTAGDRCDTCLPGYEYDSNGNCVLSETGPGTGGLPCRCDPRGEQGPCYYGQCQCKSNVEGDSCNVCRPGTFNLAENNPAGCLACYCSGVTRDCQAASYYSRIPIPVIAINEQHGFTLQTIEANKVINDNIILNQQSNQLGYIFGTYPPRDRLYWSVPSLPGNRITSYGGNLLITQRFESGNFQEMSDPAINVVLVGSDLSIYWTNSRTVRSGETLTYQVPLREGQWQDLASAGQVTRDQFLSVLSELRRVLVLATMSPGVTSTYIADVSMDTAIPNSNRDEVGDANDVELCQCPTGYSGTSCEQCASGWYRDESNRCVECPCNGRADSCQLAPNGEVLCNCRPPYSGRDCASVGVIMELHPMIHDDGALPSSFQKNVTLTCRYSAPEPLTIQFIYDGKEIVPSKKYSESVCSGNGCRGEYSWSTVWDTRRKGNIVECHTITRNNYTLGMLTTSLGSDTGPPVTTTRRPATQTTVTVQITKPMIEIVALGSTVNFTCTARSRLRNYPLSVAWSKAGGSLPSDRTVEDQQSGLLIITNVQVTDSGTYVCQATDGISYNRDTVSFTVPPNENSLPVVTVVPPFLQVNEGDLVELECRASGNPQPSITWVRSANVALPYSSQLNEGVFRIESARVSDSGEYRCVARNAMGSAESTAALVVANRRGQPVPIQLTISPSEPNVQEGQNTQISCTSSSIDVPADTIQWTRQGSTDLPSNTREYNGVLYIDSARPENTGVYVCHSSVADFIITPVQVALHIQELEPVTSRPGDEPGLRLTSNSTTIPTGESRTIECIPLGFPLPIVKWKKYNAEFGRGVSQRGNALVISQAEDSDYGYYVCEATLADGTPVTQAYLSVTIERREKPVVEIWPTGVQAVTIGSSFELHCRVTAGDPEPVVTWSRRPSRPMSINTQILPDNILRFSDITVNDEGEYVCSASNVAGESTAGTTLSVQSTPRITITPEYYIRTAPGQPIKVDCRANGYPEPMVYWRKETPEKRDLDAPTPNIASIRIGSASEADEGAYTCFAQSAAGKTQDQISITIDYSDYTGGGGEGSGEEPGSIYNPPVVPEPSPYYVAEGNNFDMRCNATGPGNNVEVRWSRADGYPMQSNSIQSGDTLRLLQVTSRDSGIYQCSGVDRRTGDVVIASRTQLAVERPPRISLRPSTQVVRPGQYANVECVVEGDQPMNITWQSETGFFSPRAEILIPNLRFNRIEVEDAGKYICLARNRVGEAKDTAEVKVTEHMSPPKTVSHDHTQRAQAGSLVQLSCNITGAGVMIWWTKDNAALPRTVHELNGTLRFPKVQRSDSGRYVCHIRDSYGGGTQNYIDLYIDDCNNQDRFRCFDDSRCIPKEHVCDDFRDCDDASDEWNCPNRNKRLIDEPPRTNGRVVIERPRRPETVGNNVTVTCRASSPSMRVTWEKPGRDGLNQFVNSQNSPGQSVLDIPGVQMTDAGVYRCRGENQYQQIVTDEFTLEIQPAPATQRPYTPEVERVYTAPLDSNVSLPCTNDLQQYRVEWRREYGPLPAYVNNAEPELRLHKISESDAGTYICRVLTEDRAIESHAVLRVTHVVPKFQGNGWLSLKPLPPSDLFNKLAFEISIKPQASDGIILYNSENSGRTGDMIALRLVNGVPEFQYNAGSGVTTLQGDRPLELNKWHTIRVSRNLQKLTMNVDNNGPFTADYGNQYHGLELKEPIYIGGVPEYSQLPETLTDINAYGFVGCVSLLILNFEEVSLMRQRIEDSGNLGQCDSCTPNPCRNNGVCQEAQNERGYTCLCTAGYAGQDCSRTGEACRPGICGPGKCYDTEDSYKCSCPITHTGRRCERSQSIMYPAFTGSAYLAFNAPMGRRVLRVSMKIKPVSPLANGIIMYCAESAQPTTGFTSLAVRNGYLEFRYDSGDSFGPTVLKSPRPLRPYEWTEVSVNRLPKQISMTINNMESVKGDLPASSWQKQMNWYTPLYVGGYDDKVVTLSNKTEVVGGFNGCIKDLIVFGNPMKIGNANGSNVRECTNEGPQRGDIPYDDVSVNPTDVLPSECQCRNRGLCRAGGTCDCPAGYYGRYCEHRQQTSQPNSENCNAQPCRAGGTCRSTPQGHECDCPLGYTGYNCQTSVRLQEKARFQGNGYVALPSNLLDHASRTKQTIAMSLSTTQDGVIVYQHSLRTQPGVGDFLLLKIENGLVTLNWDYGGGQGTTINPIPITDGQSHVVYLELNENEATLEVDRQPEYGTAPGLSSILNADSDIYLGGIPASLNWLSLPGLNGCIEQIEFTQYKTALNIGDMALSGVNVDRCWG